MNYPVPPNRPGPQADPATVASHDALADKLGGFELPPISQGAPVWETSGANAAVFLRQSADLAFKRHGLLNVPNAASGSSGGARKSTSS
jgi:hypothetical protein